MRMREALGLGGRRDSAPPRPTLEAARPAQHRPSGDRPGGTGHRHRFVQDGEVPVVLVNHATAGNGQPSAPRAAEIRSATPRNTANNGDITAERTARERAERQVQQAQATIRDLETKLAHAEMARSEAVALVKSEKAAMASLREECRGLLSDLRAELAAERATRERVESALRDTLAVRAQRERAAALPGVELTPTKVPRKRADGKDQPARAQRRAAAEQKPVKWWIKGRSA